MSGELRVNNITDEAGTGSPDFPNGLVVGEFTETVFTLSGTSPALDPANGTVQLHTLTGNTTYSESFSEGQAITLMIDDGAAYTVTWPSVTWTSDGGTAPVLVTTGYTVIVLWKVNSVLYGARAGSE